MQNHDEIPVESESESTAFNIDYEADDDWSNYKDSDVMQQQSAIFEQDAARFPFVGDKYPFGSRYQEPLSSLEAEYKSGSPILLEKIKVLSEKYAAIRRTRGDGNCFFRSFMFSYLEHILESQDQAEVEHVKANVEKCRKTLQDLGYADFTFEDFFSLFIEQLDSVLQGNELSISHDELVSRSRDQCVSDYVVMFFRFVTSGEIKKRSEFFEPFILGLSNTTVEQFCKTSVEPMGEESDHVHITALCDALGVPIRVVYLDRSSCEKEGGVSVNHHDFVPTPADGANASTSETGSEPNPFIVLLYRPGHYDILYKK
ncbi:OVARIAN TUMOR DOMAIN-containing deubiquitinating enzyme 1 isoform X1 [Helianthus annuus]|uniref:Ubiquitin thioesterase n=1 Tax=Helianthus annuus TaxID=4232 RepID=A0A251RSI4_HELAN|nr:OVARIAN TUMOR DOMAIN-containing deubiquitinating enzyme 1 isoform X1 [Helianthus annuus]XP_022025915.1 OVARIAN TUMOR DOMAIN-containing deubiquitinating enzyme 1 isoform X1 [Helianthus annuus]